jgi:hypothetical protein
MEHLETGPEGCATEVPAVHLLPGFALHAAELEPARAIKGNSGSDHELRVVTATLLTSEDVITRVGVNGAGSGIGLRGGSYVAEPATMGYHIRLREVRWTEDVCVSGEIDSPGRSGVVNANLELCDTHGGGGKLQLRWAEGVSDSIATVHGELGGNAIVADAPAP